MHHQGSFLSSSQNSVTGYSQTITYNASCDLLIKCYRVKLLNMLTSISVILGDFVCSHLRLSCICYSLWIGGIGEVNEWIWSSLPCKRCHSCHWFPISRYSYTITFVTPILSFLQEWLDSRRRVTCKQPPSTSQYHSNQSCNACFTLNQRVFWYSGRSLGPWSVSTLPTLPRHLDSNFIA